ncbi:hypothetical protein B0O99DRAFT_741489 [Bisporella sp. PMI_857]|nr:hypothetical protein B0O99DRAFT_741489 [Bisporella sp. PMI_857]
MSSQTTHLDEITKKQQAIQLIAAIGVKIPTSYQRFLDVQAPSKRLEMPPWVRFHHFIRSLNPYTSGPYETSRAAQHFKVELFDPQIEGPMKRSFTSGGVPTLALGELYPFHLLYFDVHQAAHILDASAMFYVTCRIWTRCVPKGWDGACRPSKEEATNIYWEYYVTATAEVDGNLLDNLTINIQVGEGPIMPGWGDVVRALRESTTYIRCNVALREAGMIRSDPPPTPVWLPPIPSPIPGLLQPHNIHTLIPQQPIYHQNNLSFHEPIDVSPQQVYFTPEGHAYRNMVGAGYDNLLKVEETRDLEPHR